MQNAAGLLVFALLGSPVSAQDAGSPAAPLIVSSARQQLPVSLDGLKAMHHVQLTVTDGHSNVKQTYAGVPLIEVMEKVDAPAPANVKGKALAEYVVATGSDGYKAVLSLAECEPGFHPGTVIVADTVDGKPLDAKQGPLKLVVEQDEKPARWVRNLSKLELKQAE